MSKLEHECLFCGTQTNFKDDKDRAFCAECYGKAFPPVTPVTYPTYPPVVIPYTHPEPYKPFPYPQVWC